MQRGDRWTIVLWVLAALNLANGLWMLAAPAGWFHDLPAAVPDTGPLNPHFVRDVGGTYVTMGAALAWAALRAADRVPLVAMVLVFHVLHAGAHVMDTLRGRLPPSHWAIDFPGVYLPTIIVAATLTMIVRQAGSKR